VFPVRDCRAEQVTIKGSELRDINDVLGHLGLFGVRPSCMPQIDKHLGGLLANPVWPVRTPSPSGRSAVACQTH
jgi:homoserine O-acetyltransferase